MAAEADEDDLASLRGTAVDRFLRSGRSYVWVRFFILRLLGAVYAIAFLVSANQLVPLIGQRGLLPAAPGLDALVASSGSRLLAFRKLPTIFLLTGASDAALLAVSWIGFCLSVAVALGCTNAIVMVALWALYLSIDHVGQIFHGYGWEIQLLETGILAAFLCPVRSVTPFPRAPPSPVVIVLMRWLIARVMLGAGLIKLRGDACWRDLTCLEFHYETQPIPGPLSPTFHRLPDWFHHGEVLANHAVEVIAPLFAFGPRVARRIVGIAFLGFQTILILSGNLSFLNWLTMVPAIACLDDELLARALPKKWRAWADRRVTEAAPTPAAAWATAGWAVIVAFLSLEPVGNMLSPRQTMNRSFGALHLVNTYGAFGSVGRVRTEVIVEGTAALDPEDPDAVWLAYEIPAKPGDPGRSLPWITPYHQRFAWQMWFLQFSEADQNPWFVHWIAKLLAGDPAATTLLERDPFPDEPPRFVRARTFRYWFADGGDVVWERELVGTYLRPTGRDDTLLLTYLRANGFGETAAELSLSAR